MYLRSPLKTWPMHGKADADGGNKMIQGRFWQAPSLKADFVKQGKESTSHGYTTRRICGKQSLAAGAPRFLEMFCTILNVIDCKHHTPSGLELIAGKQQSFTWRYTVGMACS